MLGLFIDNLVEVAKKELAWEVDYSREARCTKKFKELLSPYTDYIVPEVIGKRFLAIFIFSILNKSLYKRI